MKKTALLLILALAAGTVHANNDDVQRLREVIVVAKRPIKNIGVQKTTVDSAALKENISLSMADILTFNSPLFVKSYGRATLSTVSFRGTSPSHTQVTWNGMKINNPMLGMTDFSTIPAYFVDRASLLHGTSSVNETGGGLGGLIALGTIPDIEDGFGTQYVQGIGSFSTFDEFGRFTFGNDKWKTSTRVVFSSSPNDYKYVNRDKKENIYDDDHNIIGRYYPTERNRSASFKDLHILQEVYYSPRAGDRIGLNAWYVNSNRELPMTTTDYGDERDFENRQREQTFRGIVSWNHYRPTWRTALRGGYVHTWMAYDYRREVSDGNMMTMTHSRSKINTVYGQFNGEYTPRRNISLSADIAAHQHFVRSEDRAVTIQDGDREIIGYDRSRIELSASLAARWQPTSALGASLVMREEMSGNTWAPVIPALFVDYIIWQPANIMVKASATRNHRFPSLNDMYFVPGGNPDLRSETGWTYDAGISFGFGANRPAPFTLGGSVTWFDSYIDDWIMWLPTTKGFFTPRNVKKVRAYGIETALNLSFEPARGWIIDINSTYSWTPSINRGPKMSPADISVGRQLPYVPRHSSAIVGRLAWRTWAFTYKWAYYSERFTQSSNQQTLGGRLPAYFMSNVSLSKDLYFRPGNVQLKLAVNNLFDEEYLSVLSRPMPGINFEFFVSLTPRW